MPPRQGVSGMWYWEKALGPTQDTLWRLYFLAGLEMPHWPPRWTGRVEGWFSAKRILCCPDDPNLDKCQNMDGWMRSPSTPSTGTKPGLMACGKPLENKGAVSLAENCSSINWLEQNNQKWTSGRIYNKKKYCQQHCKWQLNYLWIMNSNHEEGDFCSVVTSAVELKNSSL